MTLPWLLFAHYGASSGSSVLSSGNQIIQHIFSNVTRQQIHEIIKINNQDKLMLTRHNRYTVLQLVSVSLLDPVS